MPETTPALRGGELNAAISKAVVRSFSDYIGRGPTKARTSIRDDLVVCLLENGLTKAERSLVEENSPRHSKRRRAKQTQAPVQVLPRLSQGLRKSSSAGFERLPPEAYV